MGKNILFRQQRLPRAVHYELQACDVHHNLHEYLYQSPNTFKQCTCIYHAAFPSGSGWLSLAVVGSLVPWSIEKPNRTDWLTRVLPTSHPQSDMNILASLRFSNACYCATTTSFLPYVIRGTRCDGSWNGTWTFLSWLLGCFTLIRTLDCFTLLIFKLLSSVATSLRNINGYSPLPHSKTLDKTRQVLFSR
jgi:hypothetical protein